MLIEVLQASAITLRYRHEYILYAACGPTFFNPCLPELLELLGSQLNLYVLYTL